MPEHKILVLGDHGRRHDPQRAMNIACIVVICVVVVAMIVATIVYFCVNKKDGFIGANINHQTGGFKPPKSGLSASAPASASSKKDEPPHRMVQMSKHGGMAAGASPSSIPQYGAPQLGPEREGIIFPKMSKEDEAELRASYQLDLVKNYAKGKVQAVLNDPKYSMIGDLPPLHKLGSKYISPRPKEDELLFQAQTRQAKANPPEYNRSEEMAMLIEHNVVPYLS